MRTTIITETHDNGEIQRFQTVQDFSWNDLQFSTPGFDKRAIKEIERLYTINIVAKNPAAYGHLVFFHVDEQRTIPFPLDFNNTQFFLKNLASSAWLNHLVQEGRLHWNNRWECDDRSVVTFLEELEAEELLTLVKGKQASLRFIPLSASLGFLSSLQSSLAVNSHFFLMDPTDLDSPFCELGTPHGLALKDKVVINPPLNHRPCLLVDSEGVCKIGEVALTDLSLEIDSHIYEHGKHAVYYFRPDKRITPPTTGVDIVIVGNRVVALQRGGNTIIPMAGFVLSLPDEIRVHDVLVRYLGLESYQFGVQVGPAMVQQSNMVGSLCCPFYNPLLGGISFPPTVYPLPYDSARAARIALGSDKDGEPTLVWAEGASKLHYIPGQGSCGASLLELAQFCTRQHYQEIINLDGGGSAQIRYQGKRYLQIADRYVNDEEAERPIPLALLLQN
ncbi:MAG: phosphodiester glycosidase family protein [Sphaerochaeta sp.]